MLPSDERLLLGPGPSLISPRVMRALGAPMLSHLDPQFLAIMDDTRARLARVFKAPERSFAFAVSGTGTSAMETTVANLVQPGRRVLSIVTGYFADRLAQMCERYGGVACARTPSSVPEFCTRPHAARGLLDTAQVPPHDVRLAHLRPPRSADRRRRGRTRSAVAAARATS